jgi:hypothetical protein
VHCSLVPAATRTSNRSNGDAQRRERRRWAIRAARTGSGRRPSRLRPEERRRWPGLLRQRAFRAPKVFLK